MPRFAVYYIPQTDDAFYQMGTSLLGYDVRARQVVAASSQFDDVRDTWTAVCRPYGFHLTICEALDCQWTTIPRVEQELADLLRCFDPARPFLLERKDDQPVGIWGEETSKSLVLLYEPNVSLRLLHAVFVARLTPLGTGSDYLRRYLTISQRDLLAHQVQQVRLFSSSTVLENWYPHFTIFNPYTGDDAVAMASHLAQLFQSYRQLTVQTICLLIQEDNGANWQIYREFHR